MLIKQTITSNECGILLFLFYKGRVGNLAKSLNAQVLASAKIQVEISLAIYTSLTLVKSKKLNP